MDHDQGVRGVSHNDSDAATHAVCGICETPLHDQWGGHCNACSKDMIYQLQRLNDYARALERNGVAAGTISRLRSIHLEEDDLMATGDMPA